MSRVGLPRRGGRLREARTRPHESLLRLMIRRIRRNYASAQGHRPGTALRPPTRKRSDSFGRVDQRPSRGLRKRIALSTRREERSAVDRLPDQLALVRLAPADEPLGMREILLYVVARAETHSVQGPCNDMVPVRPNPAPMIKRVGVGPPAGTADGDVVSIMGCGHASSGGGAPGIATGPSWCEDCSFSRAAHDSGHTARHNRHGILSREPQHDRFYLFIPPT